MTRNPTHHEFPIPWGFVERQLNEKKVADVYNAVARTDSHGAALYAATVAGRKLGLADSTIKQIIG